MNYMAIQRTLVHEIHVHFNAFVQKLNVRDPNSHNARATNVMMEQNFGVKFGRPYYVTAKLFKLMHVRVGM